MKKIILTIIVLSLVASSAITAAPYVSLAGKFHVTYPDTWHQIDFATVDHFLTQGRSDPAMLDYEAVFADKAAFPFFNGEYLILTFDAYPVFGQEQIDSVLRGLDYTFRKGAKHYPVGDLLANLESGGSNYDQQAQLFTTLSDIVEKGKVVKKSLLIIKFFERGYASFHFYAPDSTYETAHPTFLEIVNSFSTENIEDAMPKETLTVADIDPNENKSENNNTVIYSVLGTMMLIVVILLRRKKKSRPNQIEEA